MSEHTPTPWIIRSQVQQGKNKGGFYLAPDETCSAPAWGSNQANAAFIVKAVNSHDALVKALQEVLHWYGGDPNDLSEWSDCMLYARAALASIKEPV